MDEDEFMYVLQTRFIYLRYVVSIVIIFFLFSLFFFSQQCVFLVFFFPAMCFLVYQIIFLRKTRFNGFGLGSMLDLLLIFYDFGVKSNGILVFFIFWL